MPSIPSVAAAAKTLVSFILRRSQIQYIIIIIHNMDIDHVIYHNDFMYYVICYYNMSNGCAWKTNRVSDDFHFLLF